MLQKLRNLQRVIELSEHKVGLNTITELITELENIEKLNSEISELIKKDK